ncbi:hypothetical protein BDW22DRAFT_1331066 [Trametopsis cervina]|nr:hypothetical protein BDW22DRAFT_1331066 [Trametopsis cervina]
MKLRSRSLSSPHSHRRRLSKQHGQLKAVPVPTVVARSKSPVQRIDWEIPRKTLHSSIGFLTLYLYFSHGSPRPVVVALSAALAVIAPTDILRLNSPAFARVYERYLGFLMRESEKKTTNGVIWYIIGVIWVLTLYPLDISVVSILILSWADTAASTIGRLWGRYTPRLPRHILGLPLAPRKSLAGFIAGSLTGAAIAAGFWGLYSRSGIIEPIWTWEDGVVGTSTGTGAAKTGVLTGWLGLGVISIFTGIVSGISEALDVGSLDDNLTLPILSGGCLFAFFRCLQYVFS